MPFFIRMRAGNGQEQPIGHLPFPTLEEAYLDACAAIPEAAADEMRERRNPLRCAFLITDPDRGVLLEVPFTDVLPPSERGSDAAPVPRRETSVPAVLDAEMQRTARLRRAAEQLHERAVLSVGRSRRLLARTSDLLAP